MTRLQQLRKLYALLHDRAPGWDSKVKAGIFRACYGGQRGWPATERWLSAEILRAEQAEAHGRTGLIEPGEIY